MRPFTYTPPPRPTTPEELNHQWRLERRLAHQAIVTDVETLADEVYVDGRRWYDIAPLLNPHEQCPELLDMNRATLDCAFMAGLLIPHPVLPQLVRLSPKASQHQETPSL